ncbi:transferase [Streptomyces davaonensis JCM 4913]|uniref:Transferase n=1 Tax=Streptomyces davaonensis (strain DSM 101723 / JCM 4913 / KCC S-0913 / 768) TaxID=1214101 RepID=K4QSN4_STRDJ|nr:transferase [Streptomyces davaonensis]CCK24956.1 transferase [Streptomyces davaonensis JCM 4913]
MNQTPVATTPDTQPRAHCTADTDGRITFHVPALEEQDRESAQLLVRLRPKKGQPEQTSHVLPVEAADDDGGGRAVLEPQPALPEGRWDVYLLPEPGSPRIRLRPGMRDLRALVDGQTRDRLSPVAVRVPYTTKDGYLAIRTWLRTAHAEVEGIEVTDRTMTVKARLHGDTLSAGAVVRLRARGSNGPVRTRQPQVDGDGRRFSFTADLDELTAEGSRVWDVSVRPRPAEGTPFIRIGRLLDDVADRKEIFVYPAATVGGLTVRPYYTVDNDLSVEVTSP